VVQDGDSLAKDTICKVCERKFQMHIFWFTRVPPLDAQEEDIRQAYKEHKAKVKDFEQIKKDCVKKQQELVQIETQRSQALQEQASDRDQLVDLVNFAKGSTEKHERRLQDTKAEIEAINAEKKREDQNIKTLQRQNEERQDQIEKLKKQNLYLNNLIIHF
jgi:predicted  nucleic acid-binding Zn-ribbon protein